MEIIVSARHFHVSDDLKQRAEEALAKLAVEFPKLTSARVVLEMERNWHLVEVNLHGKNLELVAKARSRDMYISLDDAVDKLEKQLRRHLEKVQQHRNVQDVNQLLAEELEPELAE